MFQVLALMALSRLASAVAFPAPDATVTPAPVIKRAVTTAGYRSTGFSGGSTLWGAVTYNLQNSVISTKGDLFRICSASGPCNFFTCSGDYAMYSGTSTYCGASSSLTCSSDVSYTDLGDLSPLTNYWCDSATLDGWAIYAATTSDGSGTTTSRTTRTTDTTSTPTSGPSQPSTTSVGPTPTSPVPVTSKKSAPIGAIVGGVVGGIAVLGLIVVGLIIVLKKKKNNNSAAPTYQPPPMAPAPATPATNYVQPPYYPQGQAQSPPMGYNPHNSMAGAYPPVHEKAPNATVNASPYYVNTESGPTSPAPQYSANNGAMNELPAQRM